MKICLTLLLPLISLSVFAQKSIGIEMQAYPAGLVPTLRFDILFSEDLFFNTRVGYNFTDRRDWGKHDNEEGGGPGFSLGFEKVNLFSKNLSLNMRTDFWFMRIDWEDLRYVPCEPSQFCPHNTLTAQRFVATGNSSLIVFQPTLGLAYQFLNTGKFILKPSLSFGYEINIANKDEPVGEGAILLVGFQIGRLLN